MKLHKGRAYRDYYLCNVCGKKFDWPWELGGHMAGVWDYPHVHHFRYRKVCRKCDSFDYSVEYVLSPSGPCKRYLTGAYPCNKHILEGALI